MRDKTGLWIKSKPHILVAALCAVIILLPAYFPDAAGPANNGDFIRVMHPNKIAFLDDNPRTVWDGYGYTRYYKMITQGWRSYNKSNIVRNIKKK